MPKRDSVRAVRDAGKMFGQHLDGDFAVLPGIAGAIDFAHSAGSSRRDNLVGAQACAGSERHSNLSGRRLYLLFIARELLRSMSPVGRWGMWHVWSRATRPRPHSQLQAFWKPSRITSAVSSGNPSPAAS